MFVCTRAESVPRASTFVSLPLVHRRLFTAVAATLGLILTIGCEKPRQLGPNDSGTVVGRIIDERTTVPVGNATIRRTQNISSVSDPNGAFRISLRSGKGFVRVYAPGYQDAIVPVDVKPGGTALIPPDGYVRLKEAER